MFKRILVPLDGSARAEQAIPVAAHALMRVAENSEGTEFGDIDFMAMATHGRTGLERWAMGSVTERVLGATPLPLLIVRPQEAESKQELYDEEFAEVGIGGIHMGSGLF